MTLTYGSVCSGIEAASVAWKPLGWATSFVSEIEAAPRAVLQHRFPTVPLHGDFTTICEGEYGAIDLLVGGTPCQSFSVAGLRGGLADDRGNLALQYLRLAQRLRPRWLVWENVPGVLSSSGGRDFGAILGGMVELGYGFAYRVLDAQYVRVDGYGRAVPQRRRRVFVVGHLGDWRRPAAVLLERASLRGDPAPRREAGAGTAVGALAGTGPGGGWRIGSDEAAGGQLVAVTGALTSGDRGISPDQAAASMIVPVAFDTTQITSAQNRNNPQPGDPCHPLAAGAHPPAVAMTFDWQKGNDATNVRPSTMNVAVEHAQTLGSTRVPAVAYDMQNGTLDAELCGTIQAEGQRTGNRGFGVLQGWSVRRLTPTECERLQGFPDGWTAVPWRGGIMPDGPRYKMLGNSMAVNVMRWIGRRIEAVDALGLQIGRAA